MKRNSFVCVEMSCSSRAKTIMGKTSDLSIHEVFQGDDTMTEILLLLPPETLYKLILVSKRWLQFISSPSFRYTYTAKWKPTFNLIGFYICNTSYLGKHLEKQRRPRSEASLPLLSTSVIGDEMDSSESLKKLGYYIDSSNGFLLCGRHPKSYYLWDPNTRNHHQLPRPRVHFEELCMSLITEDSLVDGFSYKVIRAECVSQLEKSTNVRIETYFSKTSTWSYSELTCAEPISLSRWIPGRVIKGVVYWHATEGKIAIYNSNDEEKQIKMITLPKTFNYDEQVLGESADGCLYFGWSTKSIMEIWKLEKVNNVLQWHIQYKLSFKLMWRKNPSEATRLGNKIKETQLLAFFHQKSGLVYVRCSSQIFTYDPETETVEPVLYQGRANSSVWDFCRVSPYFQPIWPFSPSLLEHPKKIEETPQCDVSPPQEVSK